MTKEPSKSDRPSFRIDARSIAQHEVINSQEIGSYIIQLVNEAGLLPTHSGFKYEGTALKPHLETLRVEMAMMLNATDALSVLSDDGFAPHSTAPNIIPTLKALHMASAGIAKLQSSYDYIQTARFMHDNPIAGQRQPITPLLQQANYMKQTFIHMGNSEEDAEQMLKAECDALDSGIRMKNNERDTGRDGIITPNKKSGLPDF